MKQRSGSGLVGWLCGAMVLALYCRMTNWAGVFTQGKVFFGGLDSYYHVRRIKWMVANFPAIPTFDRYTNYPEGALIDWPHGFDLLLTFVAQFAGLTGHPQATEISAALAIPVLGALVCVAAYGVGRLLFDPPAGVLAACLAGILPLLTGYSMIGRTDHHVVEPLLMVLPLWSLLLALRASTKVQQRRWAWLTGALLAGGIGFWPGALAVSFVAAVSLLALVLLLPGLDVPKRLSWLGGQVFAFALLVMLPLSWLHPWMSKGSFAYYAPSWLQPWAYVMAASAFWCVHWFISRGWGRMTWCAGLGGVAIFWATLGWVTFADLRRSMFAAAGYLGRGEAQISQVDESLPLFSQGIHSAAQQYTWLIVLGPLLLLWLLWFRRKMKAEASQGQQQAFSLFLLWWLGFGLLAVAQLRLGSLFAPLWCVAWGACLVGVYRMIPPRPLLQRGAPILLCVLLVPTILLHRPTSMWGISSFRRSYETMQWLRKVSPQKDDAPPLGDPGFSVLTRWQWGHWLIYLAKQANVANPLGQTPTNLRGVRDSVKVYLATKPTKAYALMSQRKVRYVMVNSLLSELAKVSRHMSKGTRPFVRIRNGRMGLTPLYIQTMQHRLHHIDGRAFRLTGKWLPPLRRMRLVHESSVPLRELGRIVSAYKVFAFVKGARVTGRTTPGTRLRLSIPITTNLGRRWIYRDQVVSDASGRFDFLVPYPSQISRPKVFKVRVTGAITITTETSPPRKSRVQVKEIDVLQGKVITLPAF